MSRTMEGSVLSILAVNSMFEGAQNVRSARRRRMRRWEFSFLPLSVGRYFVEACSWKEFVLIEAGGTASFACPSWFIAVDPANPPLPYTVLVPATCCPVVLILPVKMFTDFISFGNEDKSQDLPTTGNAVYLRPCTDTFQHFVASTLTASLNNFYPIFFILFFNDTLTRYGAIFWNVYFLNTCNPLLVDKRSE